MNKPISIGIVGSGTAGLIFALMARKGFPYSDITIISSSQKGIVGVGEGSTEHWREFMNYCDIGTEDLIVNTAATHKYGIRYEGWTNKRPDYIHSISGIGEIFAFGLHAEYMKYFEDDKSLTSQTGSIGLIKNQIIKENLHMNTNQYHFDTFKLNDFLVGICFKRMIKFVDGNVETIEKDLNSGFIKSITTDKKEKVEADFWIDASGFSRVLMNDIDNKEWVSFSDYLMCDSAIAFPTESDPSGQIRPYTRARAASSGWIWEIPTQERRGNGYVFSSKFITEDEAVAEAEKVSGYKIDTCRSFKFNPGYLKNQWYKNCIAVGLSSSFVEPLEATSIGSSIIQAKMAIGGIASFSENSSFIQKNYNSKIEQTMRNILTMIRLHYISDREDTPFWKEYLSMPVNEELSDMIGLWSEQVPSQYDAGNHHYLMFGTRHFAHVMQGQNLINPEISKIAMDNMGLRQAIEKNSDDVRSARYSKELVDHKEALMETVRLNLEQ